MLLMLNSLAYNLPTCVLNLFLNKGILFASFHSKGTIPSCSDMLNTCASGVLICSTVSFSILGDIPATPGYLFSLILLILLTTTTGVTTNCPNISPSDPLNFVSGTDNELVSSRVTLMTFPYVHVNRPVFMHRETRSERTAF